MYILKIKSKANIPDYVQIRDNDFTLIAYCSINNLKETLIELGKSNEIEEIIKIVEKANHWTIKKINLNG